jgi:hypothetical protein
MRELALQADTETSLSRVDLALCGRAVLGCQAPNEKYDDRTDNCANKSGTLAGFGLSCGCG